VLAVDAAVVPVAYSYLAELEALPWSTLAGRFFGALPRFGAQSWFRLIAWTGIFCFSLQDQNPQHGDDSALLGWRTV